MEGAVGRSPPPRQRTAITKGTATTTTGKTILDLPDHTICDVLSRLPLKSIFRCKRVCKTWRNLLLDPYFAKLHRSRSPFSLIFYKPNRTPKSSHFGVLELDDPDRLPRRKATMKFRIEFPICNSRMRINGSCNGAVCLSDHNYRPISGDTVIVCNPIRARYFILPKPPKIEALSYPCGYGFGYSPSTDQYKVIRFSNVHGPSGFDCDIFSPGNDIDEWRSIGGTGPAPIYLLNIVSLNGALHWIGRDDSKLCYFDIEKEQFGNFPLPSHSSGSIGVVDDCLYIAGYNYSPSLVKIWVMKDYGHTGSLTLEWVIEQPLSRSVKPVQTLKDGTLLIIHDMKSLATYNPETRALEAVKYRGGGIWGESVAFVPSFLSLPWML